MSKLFLYSFFVLIVPGLQHRNPHRVRSIQLDVTRIFVFLRSSFEVMFVALSVCASEKREIDSFNVLVCLNNALLSSCYFYDRELKSNFRREILIIRR